MTDRKHHGRLIDTDVRIKTTPLRVWEAWSDPAKIANWFVDRAEGVAKPGEVMSPSPSSKPSQAGRS